MYKVLNWHYKVTCKCVHIRSVKYTSCVHYISTSVTLHNFYISKIKNSRVANCKVNLLSTIFKFHTNCD